MKLDRKIIIPEAGLCLTPLQPRHLEKSRKWVNSKDLWPLVLRSGRVSPADQARWYRDISKNQSKQVFAIEILDTGRHIGNSGFYEIDSRNQRASFWIIIGDQKFCGKGLGTWVTGAMMNYGFNSLQLNKIYLDVAVQNHSALAVYKKNQFKRVGLFRRHYAILGKWFDVARMEIHRADFLSKRSAL